MTTSTGNSYQGWDPIKGNGSANWEVSLLYDKPSALKQDEIDI
jgi:hypothetical protein